MVEHIEEFGARLVNRANHGATSLRQRLQQRYTLETRRTVQPAAKILYLLNIYIEPSVQLNRYQRARMTIHWWSLNVCHYSLTVSVLWFLLRVKWEISVCAGMTIKYSNIIDGNLYLNCSSVVANRHSSVYMIKVAWTFLAVLIHLRLFG